MLQAYSVVNDSCNIMSNDYWELPTAEYCISSVDWPQVKEPKAWEWFSFNWNNYNDKTKREGKICLLHIVVDLYGILQKFS